MCYKDAAAPADKARSNVPITLLYPGSSLSRVFVRVLETNQDVFQANFMQVVEFNSLSLGINVSVRKWK